MVGREGLTYSSNEVNKLLNKVLITSGRSNKERVNNLKNILLLPH